MRLLRLVLGAALAVLPLCGGNAASLLGNGEQQFVDANGKPLVGGSVCLYAPGGLTPKTTWQDVGQTTPNTSPCITLDGAGRAIIWGYGRYRQIVFDAFSNQVWDETTSDYMSDVQNDLLNWATTSGGTPNAQTITVSPAPPTYVAGQLFQFVIGQTNTGATTLDVNGLGPRNLYKNSDAGPISLAAADLTIGNTAQVQYNGNAFVIINPRDTGGGGGGTCGPNLTVPTGIIFVSDALTCAEDPSHFFRSESGGAGGALGVGVIHIVGQDIGLEPDYLGLTVAGGGTQGHGALRVYDKNLSNYFGLGVHDAVAAGQMYLNMEGPSLHFPIFQICELGGCRFGVNSADSSGTAAFTVKGISGATNNIIAAFRTSGGTGAFRFNADPTIGGPGAIITMFGGTAGGAEIHSAQTDTTFFTSKVLFGDNTSSSTAELTVVGDSNISGQYQVNGSQISCSNLAGGCNPTFANPTATIGVAAVNGSATTAMRSDAAPAIPQCSDTTFGACKVDGTTVTATAGVLSVAAGAGGISQLTGDGTAGPGTGSQALTIASIVHTWSALQGFNSGDFGLNGASSGQLKINAAAAAGTNTLTLPAGTTDFSATGGPSQVVKQTSGGGAFTVGQLSCSDLSGGCPAGTVTSVALGVPGSSLFGVTGSPVTASGTLGLTTTGTSGAVPYFDSTSTLNSSALLTQHAVVVGGGAGAAPKTLGAMTNGQLAIGSTGADPVPATLASAGGTITITNSAGGINLEAVSGGGGINQLTGDCTAGPGTGSKVITCSNVAHSWTAVQDFTAGNLLVDGATSGAITLATAIAVASGTASFPNNTGVIAELNLAQTWSAVQSFNDNDFTLNGSSSGALTLHAAPTGGTNSLTFPAGTTDFTSTGGASQVVKQNSAGAAFTVGQLSCSDLSGGCTGSGGITALTGDGTASGPGSAVLTIASIAHGFTALQTFDTAHFGLVDTSAAHNVLWTATSSTALTADRTVTLDVVNGSRTLKFGANLTIATDPGGVTGALKSDGSGTFAQAACGDLSNGATGCSTATGTSGATIPLLNGTNTFSGSQTFGTVLGTGRTVSGTSDTLAATDCGTVIEYTSGSAVTTTTLASIASGSTICSIGIYQHGAGQVTISDGSSATHVSLNSCTKTAGQYALMSLAVYAGVNGSEYNVSGQCS